MAGLDSNVSFIKIFKEQAEVFTGGFEFLKKGKEVVEAKLSEAYDTFSAEVVLCEYANNLDGFTTKGCRDLGISGASCEVLKDVLKDGVVYKYETKKLAEHFSKDFISVIKGTKPTKIRLKVLMNGLLENGKSSSENSAADDLMKKINAISNMGKYAADALPKLVQILEDSNEDVRMKAADAIATITRDVIDAYQKKKTKSSKKSFSKCMKIAIPALMKLLKEDESSKVRVAAIYALRKIASYYYVPDSIKQVITAIHDSKCGDVDDDVRSDAGFILESEGWFLPKE